MGRVQLRALSGANTLVSQGFNTTKYLYSLLIICLKNSRWLHEESTQGGVAEGCPGESAGETRVVGFFQFIRPSSCRPGPRIQDPKGAPAPGRTATLPGPRPAHQLEMSSYSALMDLTTRETSRTAAICASLSISSTVDWKCSAAETKSFAASLL